MYFRILRPYGWWMKERSCKRIKSGNRFQHMYVHYTWWSMNIHFQTSNFWITFVLFHLPSLLFHLNVFFFLSMSFQLLFIPFFFLFFFTFQLHTLSILQLYKQCTNSGFEHWQTFRLMCIRISKKRYKQEWLNGMKWPILL